MAMESIEKMKEASWAWTFSGVVVTLLALLDDTMDPMVVWVAIGIDVLATVMWAFTLMEQERRKADNKELFNH